jgi:Zn finger protein HypA/HybF involved in hydrogenase expression
VVTDTPGRGDEGEGPIVVLKCNACGDVFAAAAGEGRCPSCGSANADVAAEPLL